MINYLKLLSRKKLWQSTYKLQLMEDRQLKASVISKVMGVLPYFILFLVLLGQFYHTKGFTFYSAIIALSFSLIYLPYISYCIYLRHFQKEFLTLKKEDDMDYLYIKEKIHFYKLALEKLKLEKTILDMSNPEKKKTSFKQKI